MSTKRSVISFGGIWSRVLSRPLIRDTITTTILSVLGKGVGFLIPLFIAAWFGIGPETDAFFFAYGLIIFLATIFSSVVESIIVPFIAEARDRGDDVGAFVGRVLGMSIVGLTTLAVVFLFLVKPVLAILTNFSPEGLRLISLLFFESIPLVVLIVCTSIIAGTFNAYKIFSIPALSPSFRAVVALSFIFTFKDVMGVHAIAWGYVLGEGFRLGVFVFLLKRFSLFRLRLTIGWDEKFTEFFKTSSYQLAGMSMLAFIPIINKIMASWLEPGNVSVLEYADRLYMIPFSLFIGLMITMLSHWSARYYQEGLVGLRRDVLSMRKIIGLIAVLLTVVAFLTKGYIVGLVYGYGNFPAEKLDVVQTVFGFYLLGLVPYFLSQVYVRAFLTMKATRVLLFMAIFSGIGTVIANLILMPIMGVAGIPLAMAIVSFLSFGGLVTMFNRTKEDDFSEIMNRL